MHKSPFCKPQLAVTALPFVSKASFPPTPCSGALSCQGVAACRVFWGAWGVLGCCSPGKVLWSFALVFSGRVVLLLPVQRHWREIGCDALLARSPTLCKTYILAELGLILTNSTSFVPPQQVNQDLSRQLLQDGYHLDEVPDDEDLDLIPPKPVTSSSCLCCFGESLSCVIQ